jgi:hypothetical protein
MAHPTLSQGSLQSVRRLRQPTQPDLIQRNLFSGHFHAYASPDYLKRFGTHRDHECLDKHRIILLGGNVPAHFPNRRWLVEGRLRGQRRAHVEADHQKCARPTARLPARLRGCDAAGLSGGGERWTGAAVRRSRHDRTRRLLCLSGRAQGGARILVFRNFLVANADFRSLMRCRFSAIGAQKHHLSDRRQAAARGNPGIGIAWRASTGCGCGNPTHASPSTRR